LTAAPVIGTITAVHRITEGDMTFTGETREEAEAMRDRIKAYHARLERAYPLALAYAKRGKLEEAFKVVGDDGVADFIKTNMHPIDLAKRHRDFYDPIDNGVHICGISYERREDGEFQTVANFPSDHPRELFEQLREFAVSHAEADLVVDLCIDGDIIEDFSICRQSVELIKRKLRPA
jgi:hypothetical protein